MKKLLLAVPMISAMFFAPCEKEPETVIVTETETVTVTDTVNVNTEVPIAIVLNSLEQDQYFDGSWALYCTAHYTTKNLSTKNTNQIKIRFEVTTADGSTYAETAYVFDLKAGKETSGSTLISVGSKEAKSVKVDEIEVSIY